MQTLIAEDVLLLLLDDRSGRTKEGAFLDVALGGALLTELALAEAVAMPGKAGVFSRPKVEVASSATTTDPILRSALDLIGQRPRTAQDLVKRLGKAARADLYARLVERGLVAVQPHHVLGVFPGTPYPAVDVAHKTALRADVSAALVQGHEPSQRTAAVIAVLHAIHWAHKVVAGQGLMRSQVRKRAKAISEGDWAAEAVRAAVRAAHAATAAAATASSTAAVASG